MNHRPGKRRQGLPRNWKSISGVYAKGDREVAGADRRLAELERENAELWRRLSAFQGALKRSPVMLAQTDSRLRYTWVCNAEALFDESPVLGKRDTEIVRNSGTVALEALKREVLKTGQAVRRDVTFPLSKGPVTHDVIAEPLRDARGGATGVAILSIDVAAHRRLQAEHSALLAREHAMRLQVELDRAWLQAVYENVTTGVLSFRKSDKRAFISRTLAVMLGHPLAPAAGLPCPHELRSVDGGELDPDGLPCARALRGQTVRDEELTLQRRDGLRLPVLVNAAPIRSAAGEVEGIVVTFHDISARKELDQLQRDHVNLISHDLRTPLNMLSLSGQLLVRERLEGRLSPGCAMAVDKIERAVRLMQELVNDLLETAQFEAGQFRLNRQVVDLRQLVHETLRAALPPDQERRLRWQTGTLAVADVYGDAPRLRRVVLNFVSNAIKFSPAEQPIDLQIVPGDKAIVLSVRDYGVGMKDTVARGIFDKYRASAYSRRQGGLGLGLYACRLIVEAHGGRCWVHSVPGQGTTISASLPAAGPTRPALDRSA